LISPLVQGIVTLENLGDISAGHEGSVVEVDKDGDIKVHCWGVLSNVQNPGLGWSIAPIKIVILGFFIGFITF